MAFQGVSLSQGLCSFRCHNFTGPLAMKQAYWCSPYGRGWVFIYALRHIEYEGIEPMVCVTIDFNESSTVDPLRTCPTDHTLLLP
jgi:hypothetical protein